MITWWYLPTHFSLVHTLKFCHYWFIDDSYPDNRYPLFPWQDCTIYSPSSYYYLVHILLTIPGSCNQVPFIPISLINNISTCVNEIFSQVTINDSIQDSVILDIIPYSFHKLPEFSLCDPLCVFDIISPGKVLHHTTRRVFFAPNILNVNLFVFYHLPQKILTYINVFGMHTNLPIIH